jgi:hypothetical protein
MWELLAPGFLLQIAGSAQQSKDKYIEYPDS